MPKPQVPSPNQILKSPLFEQVTLRPERYLTGAAERNVLSAERLGQDNPASVRGDR